jgi:hypothetical protein
MGQIVDFALGFVQLSVGVAVQHQHMSAGIHHQQGWLLPSFAVWKAETPLFPPSFLTLPPFRPHSVVLVSKMDYTGAEEEK